MNRPFNAKRYKRLLEGLEVAALRLSNVTADNRVFRFDAQYFGKTALSVEAEIERGRWGFLSSAATKVASFGAYALTNQFAYVDEGVPFLRCQNIRDGFVDFADVLRINGAANELLAKSAVLPGMVLLTMSGSVGNAAVALPDWTYPVNSNQDVAKITPNKNIDPYYLSAFLSSRYGRVQTERLPVGSVQQHIFLSMIERLKIARFSDVLESGISRAVSQAYESERSARKQIIKAETTLTAALGLEDWQPQQSLSYTRRASHALAAGRIDAEHFQEQYFSLASKLRSYAGGIAMLRDICPVPVNGVEIREYVEDGVPYLRVGDVQHFTIASTCIKRVSTGLAKHVIDKVRLRAGDVLVSRSGSLAVTCVIEPDWQDALISSHLIRLRITNPQFDPYYVAAFLAFMPGKMQIEQQSNGGVQPEINQPALKSILIPRLDPADQNKIRVAILGAHAARHHARELLAAAQRAVEIAIKESEAAALAHLAGYGIAG